MLAEIFWDRIEITASFSVFIRSQADRPQESPCVAGEWNGRQCQQVQSNTCPGKNDFPDLIASLKLGVTSKVTHGRYSDSSLRMQGQHEKGIQMYGSITERTGKKLWRCYSTAHHEAFVELQLSTVSPQTGLEMIKGKAKKGNTENLCGSYWEARDSPTRTSSDEGWEALKRFIKEEKKLHWKPRRNYLLWKTEFENFFCCF